MLPCQRKTDPGVIECRRIELNEGEITAVMFPVAFSTGFVTNAGMIPFVCRDSNPDILVAPETVLVGEGLADCVA